MTLEEDSYVILPNTAEFSDMVSSLNYEDNTDKNDENVIAAINYTYSDIPVGSCKIIFSKSEKNDYQFAFGNPIPEIFGIVLLAVLAIIVLFIISVINSYSFSARGQSQKRRRKRRQESRLAQFHTFRRRMREKQLKRKRRTDYKKRR